MDWLDILKTISALVTSIGLTAAITVVVVSFSANFLAGRLSQKYQSILDDKLEKNKADYKAILDEQLEKNKAQLDNKKYITKTKFDTEFNLYRDLSLQFYRMFQSIYALVPFDSKNLFDISDIHDIYDNAYKNIEKAESLLFANIAFIPEDIYQEYKNQILIAQNQLEIFEAHKNQGNLNFSTDERNNTKVLYGKYISLSRRIRDYISSLAIIN